MYKNYPTYPRCTLNHWPFNQVCMECQYDRFIQYKDGCNDDEVFHGRASICTANFDAAACPMNDFVLTEKERKLVLEKLISALKLVR